MKEELFRKKSMDKISSPEQLDEYMKVSNPGVWMILSCIIIFLVGMCVWGIFGRLETTLHVSAVSADGATVCYVRENDRAEVAEGMNVRIGEEAYPVQLVSTAPMQVTADFDAYVMHVGNLQTGEWVYEVLLDAGLAEGIYEAEIITESIAPMSFLLN